VDPQYVKHAYISEIKGVEKRKTSPGKERLLGVEGLKDDIIVDALKRSGCTQDTEKPDQGQQSPKPICTWMVCTVKPTAVICGTGLRDSSVCPAEFQQIPCLIF
jgi:hypothetical protein